MRIKVHGGTVVHGHSTLCATCGHATIIRGQTLDEQIVDCHASGLPREVPFKVTACSAYADARLPSFMDMVRSAWVLNPHRTGKRAAGFVRGEDLSPLELAELASEAPRR